MTEGEVVSVLHAYFSSLFPKTCNNCKRVFGGLSEYIRATERLGPSVSYDADLDDWDTPKPIGSAALANCPCGSTLALTTEDMPVPERLELLRWVRLETQRRGMIPSALLEHLRDEVRGRALRGGAPGAVPSRGENGPPT